VGPPGTGYYWLAYHIGNYAVACKDCNTIRKANYFPIAGTERGSPEADIVVLNAKEKPFLLYPLGDIDDDPETLLEFDGVIAKPRYADGHSHLRAQVTIDFFKLNSREELWRDRFRTIREVWFSFQTLQTSDDPNQREAAKRSLEDLASDASAQAACARSFLKLIESDPIAAWGTYQISEDYINSVSQPTR